MPSDIASQVVLITGCSSGIGRATAELMLQEGMTVCATARRESSVCELSALCEDQDGIGIARRLDVTDTTTITPVIDELVDRFGRIDVLVNNAGYGQIGAVEDVPCDKWRAQMETNLIGVAAMVQATLPMMRQQQSGRIINVSSLVAHVAMPMMSAYCASKHALEALTTALRLETAGLGIYVVSIEPGPIATDFRHSAEKTTPASVNDVAVRPAYAGLYQAFQRNWSASYRPGIKGPEHVARAIHRAATAQRPRPRYRVTALSHILPRLLAITPDRLIDLVTLKILARDKSST